MLEKNAMGPQLSAPAYLATIDEQLVARRHRKTGCFCRHSRKFTAVFGHPGINSKLRQPLDQTAADHAIGPEDIGGESVSLLMTHHGVSQIVSMKNGLATGGAAHDIDGSSATGQEVDIPVDLLEVADGNRRMTPSIKPDGRQ